jgi:REP element-mobilizing transposase RayT
MEFEPQQNRDRQGAETWRYLITFACHGAWLHGQHGAVDRNHNAFGSPFPEANPRFEAAAANLMKGQPYLLDKPRCSIVLEGLTECCRRRAWHLYAAHVRTNHVHVVVEADCTPELAMNALKAYASRALNARNLDPPKPRRWARHGSTRYLRTSEAISAAIDYVVRGQGEALAAYEAESR